MDGIASSRLMREEVLHGGTVSSPDGELTHASGVAALKLRSGDAANAHTQGGATAHTGAGAGSETGGGARAQPCAASPNTKALR